MIDKKTHCRWWEFHKWGKWEVDTKYQISEQYRRYTKFTLKRTCSCCGIFKYKSVHRT